MDILHLIYNKKLPDTIRSQKYLMRNDLGSEMSKMYLNLRFMIIYAQLWSLILFDGGKNVLLLFFSHSIQNIF